MAAKRIGLYNLFYRSTIPCKTLVPLRPACSQREDKKFLTDGETKGMRFLFLRNDYPKVSSLNCARFSSTTQPHNLGNNNNLQISVSLCQRSRLRGRWEGTGKLTKE